MSYDPTVWVNGDVITANALNNIEDGIAKSLNAIIIDIVVDDGTGDFTFVDGDGETYLYDGLLSLFDDYDVVLARYTSRTGAYLLAEVKLNSQDAIVCNYTDIYVSESYAYITVIFVDLEESGYDNVVNTYYVAVTAYNPEPEPPLG